MKKIILLSILFRPSILVGIITFISYYDDISLHGTFVYDDGGSIKNNVVVTGKVLWYEIFYRDFWGTNMKQPQSHKSFRPITTLTFIWNYIYATKYKSKDDNDDDIDTYGFHIINVLLHVIVTILVTEITKYVFYINNNTNNNNNDNSNNNNVIIILQIITGIIFGIHPIHVEAVTNITSRGELLMSFFSLIAFLIYVNEIIIINNNNSSSSSNKIKHIINIYIIPWICMTLSTFCKEQGATTLLTLVLYDFIYHYNSIQEYIQQLIKQYYYKERKQKRNDIDNKDNNDDNNIDNKNDNDNNKNNDNNSNNSNNNKNDNSNDDYNDDTIQFLKRAIILGIQTIIIVLLRYWLNGETSPDFIVEQNPAGFAKDRFTRIFSISYVYCLYIYDIILPIHLSPDWSGNSIRLITSIYDIRIIYVILLWILIIICFYLLLFNNNNYIINKQIKRIILIGFFPFIFSPFLLSSNILIIIGLMKADRVMYLPLFGFAIYEALLFQLLFMNNNNDNNNNKLTDNNNNNNNNSIRKLLSLPFTKIYWIGHVLILVQITFFTIRLHERNYAWSNALNLWISAYEINPRSHHTIYNCGYELSLQKRYVEAEQVLRPIADPHIDGPSNTFVYVMVLYNLNRCDDAIPLIDDAIHVINEKRVHSNNKVRDTETSLNRSHSNLMVAKAYCTIHDNIQLAGQRFYDAVQIDPTNQYAIDQAMIMVQRIEQTKHIEQLMGKKEERNKTKN